MSIQITCPCQLVQLASKMFVVIHYQVFCARNVLKFSVILFTVYTGGGYIEVLDKLAEDTMNMQWRK